MHPPRHKKLKANRFKAPQLAQPENPLQKSRKAQNMATVKSHSKMVALNPAIAESGGLLISAIRQACHFISSRIFRPVVIKINSRVSHYAEAAFSRMDSFLLSGEAGEEADPLNDNSEPPDRRFHFDKTWHESEEFFKRINNRFADIENYLMRMHERLQLRIRRLFTPEIIQTPQVIFEVVNAEVLAGTAANSRYPASATVWKSSAGEHEANPIHVSIIKVALAFLQHGEDFTTRAKKKYRRFISRIKAHESLRDLLFKLPILQPVTKTKLPKPTLSPADPGYP